MEKNFIVPYSYYNLKFHRQYTLLAPNNVHHGKILKPDVIFKLGSVMR